MQLDLDDKGGAKELAAYRLHTAKEDLEDAEEQLRTAEEVVVLVERYLETILSDTSDDFNSPTND